MGCLRSSRHEVRQSEHTIRPKHWLLPLPERLLDLVERIDTGHPHVGQVPLAKAFKLVPGPNAMPPLTK